MPGILRVPMTKKAICHIFRKRLLRLVSLEKRVQQELVDEDICRYGVKKARHEFGRLRPVRPDTLVFREMGAVCKKCDFSKNHTCPIGSRKKLFRGPPPQSQLAIGE